MRFGVVRLELDRPIVTAERFLLAAEVTERIAVVVVYRWIVAPQSGRASEELRGFR